MRRSLLLMLVLALGVVAAACGSSGTGGEGIATEQADGTLCDGAVGVMLPYTGTGSTDLVQMNWARVALDKFNLDHGTAFTLEPSNVDFDPEAAVSEARRLVADPNVIGIVGPKTSAATRAAGPIFDLAGLAYVSPSATNAALTDGTLRNFYRVVASDALQAPRMAEFVVESLDPKTVLIVNDDEAYSRGLADAVAAQLEASGVSVKRVEVEVGQESYSEIVTQVTPQVNVVVAPLLVGDDGARLASQLHAAGKYPQLVGGDALFVNAFYVPGAYVTTYAPDISLLPEGRDIIRLYQSIFGDFESFGGPAYVAMQVVLTAAYEACQRDGGVTRYAVTKQVPEVQLEDTILGVPVAFDERHELVGAKTFVYRVTSGGFKLIG